MASCLPHPPTIFTTPHKKPHSIPQYNPIPLSFLQNNSTHFILNPDFTNKTSIHPNPFCTIAKASSSLSNGFLENIENIENIEKDETLLSEEHSLVKPLCGILLWACVCVALFAFASGDAKAQQAQAAVQSIKASSFGLKVANFLRGSGWPAEAVVVALATLPVIELRGAIPVGYWLQLNPVLLTALSVLGNMIPVPLIILYLKPIATFLAGTSKPAARVLDLLLEKAKQKAGPIEEFQWLGLMLFVAVPFPGTGAWTGAIIASILDMPFWSALSANFFGVVLAGLLVNMLVNIGLKYAVVACIVMFIASGFMWSVLRALNIRLHIDSELR